MYNQGVFNSFLESEISKLSSFRNHLIGKPVSFEIEMGKLPKFVQEGRKPTAFYESKLPENLSLNNKINFKTSALYYFELSKENKIENEEILKKIHSAKEEKGQTLQEGHRHFPKVDLKRNTKTNMLYIGSVNTGLKNRYLYHLGYGTSPNTYSLQLIHWAKELNLKLIFGYHAVENKEILKHLEMAMWNHYKPLVGKNS